MLVHEEVLIGDKKKIKFSLEKRFLAVRREAFAGAEDPVGHQSGESRGVPWSQPGLEQRRGSARGWRSLHPSRYHQRDVRAQRDGEGELAGWSKAKSFWNGTGLHANPIEVPKYS